MFLVSCSSKPNSATEVLDRSIMFHDPNNNWNSFNETINLKSQSIFSDNQPENITLTFDVAQDRLCYLNDQRHVGCCFIDTVTQEMFKNVDCSGYTWTKDFYTYIWGLPMKLKDPNTKINTTFPIVTFNNTDCYELSTSYEKEHWMYFINTKSFYLEGFKFITKSDSTKGEIVINNASEKIDNISFQKNRTWFDLKMKLIGTDSLITE